MNLPPLETRIRPPSLSFRLSKNDGFFYFRFCDKSSPARWRETFIYGTRSIIGEPADAAHIDSIAQSMEEA